MIPRKEERRKLVGYDCSFNRGKDVQNMCGRCVCHDERQPNSDRRKPTDTNPVVTKRSAVLAALDRPDFLFRDRVIMSFIGGSELHGAKVHGTDDLDIYGVFIEPPVKALGLDKFEHFVTSTSGNERRNGPEDVDITLYSLRRWAELACKGNPTALHFLFCDPVSETASWRMVTLARNYFLSKKAYHHFVGFADNQLKRMTGERGQGKHGQRPELEARFGYDVKAGMHVIRLLNECIELMAYGTITLPRPEKDLLIKVRLGAWTQDRLCNEANKLFDAAKYAYEHSTLPEHVDRERVSEIISNIYLHDWRQRGG